MQTDAYHILITHSILTPVVSLHGWMVMIENNKGKQDGVCKRRQCCRRQVALAGTSSPAALPVWVIAQADPTHTHLQTIGLLLPMGCSGTRSVCTDTNTALKHLASFT